MWKQTTLLFICTVLLASCSLLDKDAAFTPVKATSVNLKKSIPVDFIPRPLQLVAVGDSLTEGVGDSTKQGGYLPYLASMLEADKGIREIEITNFGKKGNRTEQLSNRLNSPEISSAIQNADMVAITIGGNDIMSVVKDNIFRLELEVFQQEKEDYVSRVEQIIKVVRQDNRDAAIVLIGVYNPFNFWFSEIEEMNKVVDEWNEATQHLIEQHPNTLFVEIDDIFLNNKENLLFDDHFHPNDRGYELIAKRVFEELEDDALKELSKRSYTVLKEESTQIDEE